MRIRLSFILDVEDDNGALCRVQEIAHEVGAELDCKLTDYERDALACVEVVSEDATK